MIENAERARKLARAICSDIALYNAEVKKAPFAERAGLLAAPIKEGRELFASRVSPALAPIFEEEIVSIILPTLGMVANSRPPRSQASPSPQPVSESGGSNTLVVVVVIALLAAAAAVFLLRGQ